MMIHRGGSVWQCGACGSYARAECSCCEPDPCGCGGLRLDPEHVLSMSQVPRLRTSRGITTGWAALPRVGGAVRLRNGRLEHAPLWDADGSWGRETGDLRIGAHWIINHEEACEPEWADPLFLRLTNRALGTDFTEYTCLRGFRAGERPGMNRPVQHDEHIWYYVHATRWRREVELRVRVEFLEPTAPRPRLLADAALIFEGGELDGMKLTGLGVWTSGRDGEVIATLPAKAIGVGPYRRYHEYLRPHGGDAELRERVKRWIVSEYRLWADGEVS